MKKNLPPEHKAELLTTLKERFEKNIALHKGIKRDDVIKRLEADPAKIWTLADMERTGGEPDVVGFDKKTGEYIFFDCSPASPKGRRSLCYDRAAWESRKEHKPADTAVDVAAADRHRTSDRRRIPRAVEPRRVRPKNLELGKNARRGQRTWRSHLLRPPLRPRIHLS